MQEGLHGPSPSDRRRGGVVVCSSCGRFVEETYFRSQWGRRTRLLVCMNEGCGVVAAAEERRRTANRRAGDLD